MTYLLDTLEVAQETECDAERFVRAARTLIGTPFRLYGRDAATGIDCVGLVYNSLIAIGRKPDQLRGYRLRNKSIDTWLRQAEYSGLNRSRGRLSPGDIALISPGPMQQHLVIADTKDWFIHAHAGLRRVVRQRGVATPENIITKWRIKTA